MKKIIFISFLFAYTTALKSQSDDVRKFYVGGYYSLLIEEVLLESTGMPIQFTHHFISVNGKYALSYKWRIGMEYIVSLTNFQEINDPFHVVGFFAEYDFLRSKKSKINVRGGLSIGNLLYAGDFEPKRRSVINSLFGLSYEFKISNSLYLNAGINWHRPLNRIPYKYASGHPFLGIGMNI